ncbi:MAG TPA: hypothetical protein VKF82_01010 [Candidatus Eremiobacteraceae bacterium]|nr:hypothetical protein [Candidatus Eremiobacteraceae bacterium]
MSRAGALAVGTVAALALSALAAGCARTPAPWVLTLPSGERVTILREQRQSFDNVSHVRKTILSVDYMADHPMNDEASLQMEARRVFASYKSHVVGTEYNTVSLAAMAKTDAGDSLGGRPYYFELQSDGRWIMQP